MRESGGLDPESEFGPDLREAKSQANGMTVCGSAKLVRKWCWFRNRNEAAKPFEPPHLRRFPFPANIIGLQLSPHPNLIFAS
jgi:hypothetical protein